MRVAQDDTGETLRYFAFQAGDDASAVRWQELTRDMHLYASHADFLSIVAHRRHAAW